MCTLSSKKEKLCRNSNSLYTTIVWPSVLQCDTSYTRNSVNQKCILKKLKLIKYRSLSICKILRQWTSLPIILSSITLDFKTRVRGIGVWLNLQYLTLGHHNVLFCENCTDSNKTYSERGKCIGSVNLLVSSAWVQAQLGQTNDYNWHLLLLR